MRSLIALVWMSAMFLVVFWRVDPRWIFGLTAGITTLAALYRHKETA